MLLHWMCSIKRWLDQSSHCNWQSDIKRSCIAYSASYMNVISCSSSIFDSEQNRFFSSSVQTFLNSHLMLFIRFTKPQSVPRHPIPWKNFYYSDLSIEIFFFSLIKDLIFFSLGFIFHSILQFEVEDLNGKKIM